MADQIVVTPETQEAWARYRVAKIAKSQWTAEEKDAKTELMKLLGYDAADDKPQPVEAVSGPGEALFVVKVSERRALDTKYLRKTHPDTYAECERVSYAVSIQEVK